ncbi:MAG: NAD-dependent epimerase/dehydratase family protein [Candidatus Methylomirabilales bacterium]
MVTFLTGATGFVGSAILDRMLREGQRVLTLIRREEAARAVAAKGAHPVIGDLLSPATYRDALRGCDLLIHAAGFNAFCLADARLLYEVNVEGTRVLLQAAGEVGVKRVVYTSSAVTIGEPPGQFAQETTPHRGYFLSHYERAKHEAEQVALALANQGLPVVVLNPSSVQGPGRLHGTARILLDYINGRLPFVCGDWFSFLYIDDCVEAHLKAAERGKEGERYLLSGASVTTGELLQTMEKVTGFRRRPWQVGRGMALALGAGMEWGGRLSGRRPRFCRELARTILHGGRYDSSKAERELEISFTPLREMVTRTVVWYAQAGHVKHPLPGLASGRM